MERRVDRNTSHSAKNSETLNWLIRFENFLRKLPENVSCRIFRDVNHLFDIPGKNRTN